MSRALFGMVAALLMLATLPHSEANAVTEGRSCGGFVGAVCDRGLWCDPVPGSCLFPSAGVCRQVPRMCIAVYQPVCGCDGRTYGNDCNRQARRVPKARDGAC